MRVNYNVSSIIARNALNNNDNRLSGSIRKLSSGFKINSAEDDAAGMAISLKMSAQIRGLERANQNANDGLSVVNTADGAMAEMHDILQRLNELAIQAANGTNADSDRNQIQLEVDQLVSELDRIAETTEFNAQKLLDGSFAYKGYTNTENVKVKSYSDGVPVGKYKIEQLEYSKYEDTIKDYDTFIGENASGNVTHEKRFEASSADDVKKALDYSADEKEGYRSFPDGAKILLDDEDIIIKAENDFEIKLTVNDRDEVQDSGAPTNSDVSYYHTDEFRNISLKSEDGTKNYNIEKISIYTEYDLKADGSPDLANPKNSKIITDDAILYRLSEELGSDFADDFPDKNVVVTDCTYDSTTGEFTVTAKAADDNSTTPATVDHKFKVYIPTPNDSNLTNDQYINTLPQKVQDDHLNKYLYTHTETTKTTYTVGKLDDPTITTDKAEPIVLDITGKGAMMLQVGANEGQTVGVEIPALQAYHLGVDGLSIATEDKATEAIDKIDDAINQLSGIRAKIGAYANRIEHTITNLDTTVENMTAAYSRIMDVDMATEMTEYSTVQVLVQSSTSMLAQANERPQQVLQLLQ